MKKLIFALAMSLIIPASISCGEGRSKQPSNGMLIFGGVLVLGAAGYGIYHYTKPSDQQLQSQTSAQKNESLLHAAAVTEDGKKLIELLNPKQQPTPTASTAPSQNTQTEKSVNPTAEQPKKPILVAEQKKPNHSATASANNKSFLDCLHTTASSSNWDQFAKNNIELYDY